MTLASFAQTFLLAAAEGEEKYYQGLLDFNASMLVWTVVVFIALLLILSKFAWPQIAKQLDERASKIEGEIQKAKDLRAEAESEVAAQRQMVEDMQRQISEMQESAKQQAEEAARQAEQRAEERAAQLQKQAEKDVELMVNKVRGELKELVAELTVQAATELLSREVSGDDQRRFAQETIEKIGSLDRNRL